jgi:hypothetical protein
MSEDKTIVEPTIEKAPEVTIPEASQENEILKTLQAKDDEIARLARERDNYRKGMLKAKGKKNPYDDDDEPDMDEIIDRKVEEKILAKEEDKVRAERDQMVQKLAIENAELRKAVTNRAQVKGSAGEGANSEELEVKKEFFSKEQLEDLKAKGLDPEKVKENLLKYKNKFN